jgi:hypothetical protein
MYFTSPPLAQYPCSKLFRVAVASCVGSWAECSKVNKKTPNSERDSVSLGDCASRLQLTRVLNHRAFQRLKATQEFTKATTMVTQFVTDDHGKKIAVILPIKTYNKMLSDLEELEDIKSYDAAKAGDQEFLDAEEAFKEIEKVRAKGKS